MLTVLLNLQFMDNINVRRKGEKMKQPSNLSGMLMYLLKALIFFIILMLLLPSCGKLIQWWTVTNHRSLSKLLFS